MSQQPDHERPQASILDRLQAAGFDEVVDALVKRERILQCLVLAQREHPETWDALVKLAVQYGTSFDLTANDFNAVADRTLRDLLHG